MKFSSVRIRGFKHIVFCVENPFLLIFHKFSSTRSVYFFFHWWSHFYKMWNIHLSFSYWRKKINTNANESQRQSEKEQIIWTGVYMMIIIEFDSWKCFFCVFNPLDFPMRTSNVTINFQMIFIIDKFLSGTRKAYTHTHIQCNSKMLQMWVDFF